jgi:hypothetical protein
MSGYVLIRNEDNKFVAPDGSQHSYTRDLTKAKIFPSKEAAQSQACSNERAVPVDSLLAGERP